MHNAAVTFIHLVVHINIWAAFEWMKCRVSLDSFDFVKKWRLQWTLTRCIMRPTSDDPPALVLYQNLYSHLITNVPVVLLIIWYVGRTKLSEDAYWTEHVYRNNPGLRWHVLLIRYIKLCSPGSGLETWSLISPEIRRNSPNHSSACRYFSLLHLHHTC